MPIITRDHLVCLSRPARPADAGSRMRSPCKTHADPAEQPRQSPQAPLPARQGAWWGAAGRLGAGGPRVRTGQCDSARPQCVSLAQGNPAGTERLARVAGFTRFPLLPRFPDFAPALARLWLVVAAVLCSTAPASAAVDCPPGAPSLRSLAPGVWQVPAEPGDATAANRGQVSNLLVVADGPRLWLLGSGPSPAAGARLACVLRRDLGRDPTDVVSPWPRPELVLGMAGLAGAPRHWAQADVADAMAKSCAGCAERLRARLGPAADELGPDPIRLPAERLSGDEGRLGPFSWWKLERDPGHPVTIWRLALPDGTPLWWSPGLLNGGGPADGRDAHLPGLKAAAARLVALTAVDGARARHLGEQGELQPAALPVWQQAYWLALEAAVRAAQDAGRLESDPAPAWAGLPPGWAAHPWHALNWQRTWREIEAEDLPAPKR